MRNCGVLGPQVRDQRAHEVQGDAGSGSDTHRHESDSDEQPDGTREQ